MPHAAIADLLVYGDIRTINDLVNDIGVRESELTSLLTAASGEVDAAIRKGDRYSETDLSGLTGNALAYLKRITSAVALSLLCERRPGMYPELADKFHERARGLLKRLATGDDVFALESQQAKSHPTVDGPSLAEMSRMNDLLPQRASRAYPTGRARRWPIYTE
jgi:hypothetical protein